MSNLHHTLPHTLPHTLHTLPHTPRRCVEDYVQILDTALVDGLAEDAAEIVTQIAAGKTFCFSHRRLGESGHFIRLDVLMTCSNIAQRLSGTVDSTSPKVKEMVQCVSNVKERVKTDFHTHDQTVSVKYL